MAGWPMILNKILTYTKGSLIFQTAFLFPMTKRFKMAKGRTSITERLRKSQKKQKRIDFAHEWADDWEQSHINLISQLKKAISSADDDLIIKTLGDLHGLHKPKFNALHNVINELCNPTRELI